MRIDGRAGWGRVLAALVVIALAHPVVASPGADAIRVLLVPSREADLDMQISLLERAIQQSPGPLALAGGLTDAHVVIQFTGYRRSTGKDGELQSAWIGLAKLLKVPGQMTVSATPLPELFELMVIGKEGNEAQRALKLLETTLTKTLRPKAGKAPREAL